MKAVQAQGVVTHRLRTTDIDVYTVDYNSMAGIEYSPEN